MGTKRFIAKTGIDAGNKTVINVADPVNAQDSATKAWTEATFVRALPASVINTPTTATSFNTYVITDTLTLTLPESPVANDIIRIVDLSNTSSVIISRNGQKINNIADDITLDYANASLTLQYVNLSIGWIIF